ncbi:MAG: hypothetical protein Q8934_00220 [Bacillota bacterium]|nr:hypothetical protein [Bacillota bacterium]
MNPIRLLQGIIAPKQISNNDQTGFSLRPGQIINGKILKLFKNQMAEVQVGTQKMIARLEVPLSANERYWFQVQSSEGQMNLKLISKIENTNHTEGLLNQFGLPASKENIELLNFILDHKIPIEKNVFQEASVLLKDIKLESPGMNTIKLMIEKGLPLTKSIFTSLMSLQKNEPIHQLLEKLFVLIKDKEQTDTTSQLRELLEKQIGVLNSNSVLPSLESSDSSTLSNYIKHMIQAIGYDYEQSLVEKGADKNSEMELSLKPLLLRFLNEHPHTEHKAVAEQILNQITALQILSHDTGPIQQVIVQIPLLFGQQGSDLLVQWNGRKKQDGKIDPNYCRVLFYIDLTHIGDTIIDMQIKNRIMSISIVNGRDDLKEIASPLIQSLKEELEKMDYHLSSIKFAEPSESSNPVYGTNSLYGTNSYEGVDFRI